MKITATLSFLALLPAIVAQCDFCPSGITGTAPPELGVTCADVATGAMSPTITTEECGDVKTAFHALCCPADVGPGCDYCTTGVENEDFVLDEEGTTCGAVGLLAKMAAQELCPSYTLAESDCCPEKTGTVCDDLCPSGVVDGAVIDTGDGNSLACADAAAYSSILSSDADTCSSLKFQRGVCCPNDVGPGCSFCEGGVSSPETVLDEEEGITCADLEQLASSSPQEQCANFGSAQLLCCPQTQAPDPTDAPVVAPTTAPADAAVGLSTMFGLMATALIGFLSV